MDRRLDLKNSELYSVRFATATICSPVVSRCWCRHGGGGGIMYSMTLTVMHRIWKERQLCYFLYVAFASDIACMYV
jgi:hypothetical protein